MTLKNKFNKQELIHYSKGNPGALNMLLEVDSEIIVSKINRIEDLRGIKIYVLYSDLCSRDMSKVKELCEACPDDILLDACSRQDYSGKELVSKFFT